jgi:hypothetical protein
LPGYGTVVLRSVRPLFERRVRQLQKAVTIFQKQVERQLQAAMDKNRGALVNALLPGVMESPPKSWRKYGDFSSRQSAAKLLDRELASAFGDASQLVREMKVRVIFKGVTYQSLIDPRFQEIVKKHLPFLAATHEEHSAAPESRPVHGQKSLFV